MSRPEHIAPAEVFYGASEAEKYTSSTRMVNIQTAMAERCLELLNLPAGEPKLLLDIGCGSGLSGAVLSEAGHVWVGMDISADMVAVALARGAEGDVLVSDMGQGFGFRPGSFDGAVSVSAVQWLCHATRSDHSPVKRMMKFFTSLYQCLKRGARAALQIYPESAEQLDMLTTAAQRCGFSGGLVVDFPNSTKAKKYFLCLFAGTDPATAAARMPHARGATRGGSAADDGEDDGDDDEEDEEDDDDEAAEVRSAAARSRSSRAGGGGGGGSGVSVAGGAGSGGMLGFGAGAKVMYEERKQKRTKNRFKATPAKDRNWILMKKERARKSGKEVPTDSKFTGRKRKSLVRFH